MDELLNPLRRGRRIIGPPRHIGCLLLGGGLDLLDGGTAVERACQAPADPETELATDRAGAQWWTGSHAAGREPGNGPAAGAGRGAAATAGSSSGGATPSRDPSWTG